MEKDYYPERTQLEANLRGLGLSGDQIRDYTSAKFDKTRYIDSVLSGPVIAFSGSEREIGMRLSEAERTIREIEAQFLGAREFYDDFLSRKKAREKGS